MKILIACEESQRTCAAYRKLGLEAYSCDIINTRGNEDWHIKGDAREILNGGKIKTQSGKQIYIEKWDIMIAHPPCTYLTKVGALYMFPNGKLDESRYEKLLQGKELFMTFYNANIKHICIENPIPLRIANLPEPTQMIQPYMFGDPYTKKTYLWQKNLPQLIPTQKQIYEVPVSLMKKRSGKYRSVTPQGIANAFANQYRPPFTYFEQLNIFEKVLDKQENI